MARHRDHPPASDFRDRKFGPDYHGPDDETIILEITGFYSRPGCTHDKVLRQFGAGQYWPEKMEEKLTRLVNEGRLIAVGEGKKRFYRFTGKKI